jgi:uncharacterized SAM-binding protein YcdF (DUF218 family)
MAVMSLIRSIVSVIVLGCVVLLCLFVGFTWEVFSLKPKQASTDAVVVLAGGKGRIEEGIRLYRAGGGAALYLIGVDPSVRKRDLVKERPDEQIILEKQSRTTLENAFYARDLLARRQVRSLQLITSRYHMLRAELIFRNLLAKDIAIYPHPVDSRNFREEWWRYGGSFRLLFTEFYKYCLYRLFFVFASGELRPGVLPVE